MYMPGNRTSFACTWREADDNYMSSTLNYCLVNRVSTPPLSAEIVTSWRHDRIAAGFLMLSAVLRRPCDLERQCPRDLALASLSWTYPFQLWGLQKVTTENNYKSFFIAWSGRSKCDWEVGSWEIHSFRPAGMRLQTIDLDSISEAVVMYEYMQFRHGRSELICAALQDDAKYTEQIQFSVDRSTSSGIDYAWRKVNFYCNIEGKPLQKLCLSA